MARADTVFLLVVFCSFSFFLFFTVFLLRLCPPLNRPVEKRLQALPSVWKESDSCAPAGRPRRDFTVVSVCFPSVLLYPNLYTVFMTVCDVMIWGSDQLSLNKE